MNVTQPTPAQQLESAASFCPGVPLFVSADADLVAKPNVEQDSWFTIVHFTSGSTTFDVLVHFVRVTQPTKPPFVQSIVSVLDPVTGKYLAEEKVCGVEDSTMSNELFDVRTPFGAMAGSPAAMEVTAKFDRIALALTLRHEGPLLANAGNGLLPFYGNLNYEYALPNMATTGWVEIDGQRYEGTGTSWFDRQWGLQAERFWTMRKWSWMGISLDNGLRISLWDIVDPGKDHAFATVLHPDGRHELVAVEPLIAGASGLWRSPATGHRYHTHWNVSIPSLQARFEVAPLVREQEVVSPRPDAHKYEAASRVTGEMRGEKVSGHCVVELVGFWK